MATATIKLFLVHGDPKRLRTAELSNWSGKAVAGPRSEFDGVLAREESQQSGVYLLTGIDPDTGKSAIYIGEAECIKDRIKTHLNKDFWNQIVFFVTKDENLTKSHIRHLEGQLIEQARSANRAIVTNSQGSGSKLPESDIGDMVVFLEKINQLLPVLGVELLVAFSSKTSGENSKEQNLLLCKIKDIQARGFLVPNGLLVLKGSEAVLNDRPSVVKYPWAKNMRQKLLDEGYLTATEEKYIFTSDFEFSSPSAAAAVIHGGQANGLTAWKNKKGQTLKNMEST